MRNLRLTFDDAPGLRWAPPVLDALCAAETRATFFELGERVRRRIEVVRRTIADGHEIGVHADRHALSAEVGTADLDRALEALDGVAMRPAKWRTPCGTGAEWTRPLAAHRGLDLVGCEETVALVRRLVAAARERGLETGGVA